MKIVQTAVLRKHISRVLDAVVHQNQIIGVGRRNKVEAILVKWPARYNDDLGDVTNMNANSSSFDFLETEPDLYSIDDLRKRYV